MKKILVFGATGAMGKSLLEFLVGEGYDVYGTSRNKHFDNHITWIQGNAHDLDFVKSLFEKQHYDCLVDFMNYTLEEFKERYDFFLHSVSHYIFTSSARVYAPNPNRIAENSKRLIDTANDKKYLAGNWYELTKAREEDLLLSSSFSNFTIIRPSLTYNDNRLQLALFEQNEFLDRIVFNRTIIFPRELTNVKTTMTYGGDVAYMIGKLVLNKRAFGEVYNVATYESKTWSELLDIYCEVVEKVFDRKIKIQYVDDCPKISRCLKRFYQYKYARGISRSFSCSKLEDVIGKIPFTDVAKGISDCTYKYLTTFTKNWFDNSCAVTMGYIDKMTGEKSLRLIRGFKNKIRYLLSRFTSHYQ